MALDPHIKAVGFDMDGTVMNTNVDYVRLARIVEDEFIEQGVPEEVIEQDKKVASMEHGLKWLMENKPACLKGMNGRIGDRATVIEMEHADQAKPFDGAEELLKELKARGYKVALLTRGGREYATTILSKCGLLELFDALVARDDYPHDEAKPSAKAMEHVCEKIHVSCDEVLYVGDGETDYLTTKNSGSQFIGVETGHMTREKWVALAGESVVSVPSIADIRKMI